MIFGLETLYLDLTVLDFEAADSIVDVAIIRLQSNERIEEDAHPAQNVAHKGFDFARFLFQNVESFFTALLAFLDTLLALLQLSYVTN
jgi:hypothetical protein